MAMILGPDDGRVVVARGSTMLFKALAATTGGRFSLMIRDLPPGGRMPPPHRHPATVEAFLVLDGSVAFRLDGERSIAGQGTFVLVPEGLGHTFGNDGTATARVLIVHAPALDEYFEDLAALWSGGAVPEQAVELELMRRHGLEPIVDE